MDRMQTLVPAPSSFSAAGGTFSLPSSASVAWRGPDSAGAVAGLLAGYLRDATGFPVPVRGGDAEITLVQTGDPAPDADGFLPESYTIAVDAASGIRVEKALQLPERAARYGVDA